MRFQGRENQNLNEQQMFCMHTSCHLLLHLWNLLSACHSLPTVVCMQVIKIKFFGPGDGVEKWARAKVQIIPHLLFYLGLKRSDL